MFLSDGMKRALPAGAVLRWQQMSDQSDPQQMDCLLKSAGLVLSSERILQLITAANRLKAAPRKAVKVATKIKRKKQSIAGPAVC